MWKSRRWRTVFYALLVVLPGGLWLLGAIGLVNALRRQRAAQSKQPLAILADTKAGRSDGYVDTASPRPGGAAISTWF